MPSLVFRYLLYDLCLARTLPSASLFIHKIQTAGNHIFSQAGARSGKKHQVLSQPWQAHGNLWEVQQDNLVGVRRSEACHWKYPHKENTRLPTHPRPECRTGELFSPAHNRYRCKRHLSAMSKYL
jgi:hypothetical protein